MDELAWLPVESEWIANARVTRRTAAGQDWQIYELENGSRVLVARVRLAERWTSAGLIEPSLLEYRQISGEEFASLVCSAAYTLAPLKPLLGPETVEDTIAFASALRETRFIVPDGPSLHDAIYVEQHSRLLPTWTVAEPMPDDVAPDDVVLGTYLTGGVHISVHDKARMRTLLGGVNYGNLDALMAIANVENASSDEAAVRIDRIVPPGGNTSQVALSGRFRLPGRPHLEQFFNEHVVDIVRDPERYARLGVGFPSPILLYGPPGSGKTYAVERLVEYLRWPLFEIEATSVGSPYIHETSRQIGETFERAAASAPSIVVIDEMDSLLLDRKTSGSTGRYAVEEVAEFLRQVPEASQNRVLVVGMTNLLELLDPAMLRRGRFDHVIEVGMPTREEVQELVDSLLARVPVRPDLDRQFLVAALTGRPLSDAAYVVREAGRHAAKAADAEIGADHLSAALEQLLKEGAFQHKVGFGPRR